MKIFQYVRIVIYVCILIFATFVFNGAINIPCRWKEQYNFTCPSCGITRATKSIFSFQFVKARAIS